MEAELGEESSLHYVSYLNIEMNGRMTSEQSAEIRSESFTHKVRDSLYIREFYHTQYI